MRQNAPHIHTIHTKRPCTKLVMDSLRATRSVLGGVGSVVALESVSPSCVTAGTPGPQTIMEHGVAKVKKVLTRHYIVTAYAVVAVAVVVALAPDLLTSLDLRDRLKPLGACSPALNSQVV